MEKDTENPVRCWKRSPSWFARWLPGCTPVSSQLSGCLWFVHASVHSPPRGGPRLTQRCLQRIYNSDTVGLLFINHHVPGILNIARDKILLLIGARQLSLPCFDTSLGSLPQAGNFNNELGGGEAKHVWTDDECVISHTNFAHVKCNEKKSK